MISGFLPRFLALASLFPLSACGGAEPDRVDGSTGPPNLILILADDLGYNDLGSYWTPGPGEDDGRIETPNVDRMAAEGVRFTNFYAAASVCTLSRAALLTGSYPPRVGLSRLDQKGDWGTLKPSANIGLNPDEITLAELLGERGYATALIGKWHVGFRAPFLPNRQGFGRVITHRPAKDFMSSTITRDGVDDGEFIGREKITPLFTDEAIRFITENQRRPFFLFLSHMLPHRPHAVSDEFSGRSVRGPYGDAVMDLDRSTGRVLDELGKLGLERRTMVIFSSDNGALLQGPEGSNAPLRGGKSNAFEGGFRVPCVVWWPGTIPPGLVTDELATNMDFYPTFAALAGISLPVDRTIDGRNIQSLMVRPDARSPHESCLYYHKGMLLAIRAGQWKLQFDQLAAR